MDPVARGGTTSARRMRLRCRAHNQYEAERTFGREFMEAKRRSSAPRAGQDASADLDVTPWLRALGFRADEARRAAEHCEGMAFAPLEDRVRSALSFFHARASRQVGDEARPGT